MKKALKGIPLGNSLGNCVLIGQLLLLEHLTHTTPVLFMIISRQWGI